MIEDFFIMKLNLVGPNVETSADLEEQFFSIGNQGIIFDILRSKLYSNPILAVCREISANARDGVREAGKPNEPIEITLPNHIEPYWRCADNGVGLSPDRIENIYLKYGNSTKRETNELTGAMGIGAKSPMSVSDAFSILTRYNGRKYNYSCFIDAGKTGKIALLSEVETNEPNGTEIIVPVKIEDFTNFNNYTEQACRHFSPRPIIRGGNITWQEINKTLEGSNWAFANNKDRYSYDRSIKMIVDGFEYPVDLEALKKFADISLIESSYATLYLYWNTGELSLNAGREAIHLDKPTQEKISIRLAEITKEIKQTLIDKIQNFPSYWNANVYFKRQLPKIINNLSILGKLNWHGLPLHDGHVNTECTVYSFYRNSMRRNRYQKQIKDLNSSTRNTQSGISFIENTALYLNDLDIKDLTPKYIKQALINDPNLESVQVVCPNDITTLQVLIDKIHFDKMDYKLLSTIAAAPKTNKPFKLAKPKLNIFRWNGDKFFHISYKEMEQDLNQKVLVLFNKIEYSDQRKIFLKDDKFFDSNNFYFLRRKYPNVSFYGIDKNTPPDRIEEEFSSFITLDDFLEKKVIGEANVDFVEIKYAQKCNYNINNDHFDDAQENVLKNKIKNKNSPFLKKFYCNKKIKDIAKLSEGLLPIYELLNGKITDEQTEEFGKNHPEYNTSMLIELSNKTYPLLTHMNSYSYRYNDEPMKHVVHYINLIDQENENKNLEKGQ